MSNVPILAALLLFLSHSQFVPDPTEDWQAPEEFAVSRRGDCEDFAGYACHQLRLAGYPACLISAYRNDGTGHTVCVFAEGPNQWSVIDGARYMAWRQSFRRVTRRLRHRDSVLQVVSERDSVSRQGCVVTVLHGRLE